LEDTDDIAQSDTILQEERQFTHEQVFETIDIPEWSEALGTDDVLETQFVPSAVKRSLCGFQIYQHNDKDLPKVLMSVISKMYYSPRDQVPLLSEDRAYISMNKTSWFWSTCPSTFKSLNFSKVPTAQAKNLLLLRDLGGGIHGRTWLTCSTTGRVCVIKFAQDNVPRNEVAQKEGKDDEEVKKYL
jgi:hypothetical protein